MGLAFLMHSSSLLCQSSLPPVGQWRDHLPYKTVIGLTQGENNIFCATPFSVFSLDLSEYSITRYSKTNGLHATGVRAIEFDEQTQKLLIAYTNSDIDILYRNDVYHVPDIKRANLQADKTIYSIYTFGGNFYLSSGLGIIIIDGEKYEVKDTWRIGNGGNYVKVNGITVSNGFYYAATEEGLKSTAVSNNDPANFNNWQQESGLNGLPPGNCKAVLSLPGTILSLIGDSLFIRNGNNWDLLYNDIAWSINRVSFSDNRVLVCQQKNQTGRIAVLDMTGAVSEYIQDGISVPADVLHYQGNYWIADPLYSLLKYANGQAVSFRPASPDSVATGQLLSKDQVFLAAAGTVNEQWEPRQNTNGLFRLADGDWTNYNSSFSPVLDSVKDIIAVANDPVDGSIWAGSFGGGLLHIPKDQSLELFKQNSPIQPANFDRSSYRVAGLAFDHDHNLWMANDGASRNLLVKKNDGNWVSFTAPFSLTENAAAGIIIDDSGQKWMISPKGNGLICFDDNHSIDNPVDDRWKLFRFGAGNGNLPSNNVLSILLDKSGFIWVGTDDGMAVIQCPQQVFSSPGCEAVLPIVQQGNFAGYLFKGEEVRSMAVDGADRKWVATSQGVFLISADGEKLIEHFTEENSALLSNDVRQVCIDNISGEVFLGTVKGICSFRGTATTGGSTNSNVLVFPNPVPPGYAGTIAIRGLVEHAVVKITELDGRLVYQTRALGGQAIWDGKDYRGKKISTGVYLVLVSDDSRQEKLATKIVFIAR